MEMGKNPAFVTVSGVAFPLRCVNGVTQNGQARAKQGQAAIPVQSIALAANVLKGL